MTRRHTSKKLHLTFALICITFFIVGHFNDLFAQSTAIPDPNFEQALIDLGIDSDGLNGQILNADAVGITALNVSSRNISDLSGIEIFIDLKSLSCHFNLLTSLDVSANTSLLSLWCHSNQLSTLNVSANTSLQNMGCNDNQLMSLDVSNNTELLTLQISSNQLMSLDVSNNTELLTLQISFNQLVNLDLSNNTALVHLVCQSNQLVSLDLSNNIVLNSLYCQWNQLVSLDLSNNTALQYLYCQSNQLVSLDVSNNTSLEEIGCTDNQLNSLDVRNGNNTSITYFQAQNNPDLSCIYVDDVAYANANWTKDASATFTSSDTDYDEDGICDDADPDDDNDGVLDGDDSCPQGDLGWTSDAITDADADGCQDATEDSEVIYPFTLIPDPNFEQALIDLGIDTDALNGQILNIDALGVTSLNLSARSISDLTGIEAFVDLEFLNCNVNNLSSLDLGLNDGLMTLFCHTNSLMGLDISSNLALTYVDCHSNTLNTLDVSNNDDLETLICYDNQLGTLDVSQNTILMSLDCRNNFLPSLNINLNTALKHLYCGYNQLSSLDVSNNSALLTLDIHSNHVGTLDVSNNLLLETFSCINNQLASIDVSNNLALQNFTCNHNQLTALDVSNNAALRILWCHNNALTSLDVSSNATLERIRCSNNQLTSLDVRNGNNTSITDFQAENNLDLSCIYVDDVAFANANWTKDASATFTTSDSDYDADGICDDADPDDDNDGVLDDDDSCPQGDLGWTSDATTDVDADGCQDATEDPDVIYPYTLIPDPNFEQALIDLGIDSDGLNGQILNADAMGVASLDVSSEMISDLTGIEAFQDVTWLNCVGNNLSNLDLSNNAGLEFLQCNANHLTALDLTNNPMLLRLFCNDNQIESLDLSTNPLIWFLACGFNQLNSLDLSANNALQQVYCQNNPSLNFLDVRNGNNTAITTFNATNNPGLSCIYVDDVAYANATWTKDATATFSDSDSDYDSDGICDDADPDDDNDSVLDGDDTCPQGDLGWTSDATTDVDADGCQDATEDPEVIYPFTLIPDPNFELALIDLGIDKELQDEPNPQDQINGRILNSDAETVVELSVVRNITDLTGIEAFTALTHLRCSNNQLSSLDVTQNPALTYLDCSHNLLSSLDVTQNTALTYLDCGWNQLIDLDVTQNTNLNHLVCNLNQLSSLDVTQNTALNLIECSQNQLSSLDVSQITALVSLGCSYNQLSSLDVTQNSALNLLGCAENQLIDLDVTQNTALNILTCGSNQISSLDVTQNTALTHLNCSHNQLSSLDVTQNTTITSLWCNNNQLSSLDATQNIVLFDLYCHDNQLRSLDVRNGNNSRIVRLRAENNPDLSCIFVDDVAHANVRWTKDATATFTNNDSDYDADGICDDADLDDDNDGVLDGDDSCPQGDLGWTSDASTDNDGDGCRDAGEDTDDDNDGILDVEDFCPLLAGEGNEYYVDADGDGNGVAPAVRLCVVSVPSGYSDLGGDCDDTDPNVNPDAEEICDGIDNDCDGLTDDDDADVIGQSTWYADDDGDGYGDPTSSQMACSAPPGFVSDQSDCDDTDATVYPDAPELCDGIANDCSAPSWPTVPAGELDGDGDGYVACSNWVGSDPSIFGGGDCQDGDPLINPGTSEVCDDIDNDCDGLIDADDPSVIETCGDEVVDNTTDVINDLDIPEGQVNNLTNKINDALDSYCSGKQKKALNKLKSFVENVELLLLEGEITQAVADALLQVAADLEDAMLNGTLVCPSARINPIRETHVTASEASVNLFPNPGRVAFTLQFNLPEAHSLTVDIYHMDGRRIQSSPYSGVKGHNQFTINLAHIPDGTYFVTLKGAEFYVTRRWIKMGG